MVNKQNLSLFDDFVHSYTHMNIRGELYPCPYWVNKIQAGIVVVRGFENGKGKAKDIQQELIKKIDEEKLGDEIGFISFAKRHRIGIDCSGFVYRAVEEYVKVIRTDMSFDLSVVFSGGVNRTNARTLTDNEFVYHIEKTQDIQVGDFIRLRGGKHIAIVTMTTPLEIRYAHSSHLTKVFGVHEDVIHVIDSKKTVELQQWLEKTEDGKNYRDESFLKNEGDGVFRLKVLKNYV